MKNPFSILSMFVFAILIIFISYKTYAKFQNDNCYEKCADFHLLGAAAHWDYNDFEIDNGDTIWVDEECYTEWCICIDECNPGLCCELLR